MEGIMFKKHVVAFVMVTFLAMLPETVLAQNARTVLNNVTKAMGAETLKTLQYSGSGSNAGIGQNFNPSADWPMVEVKSYNRDLDFDTLTSRTQLVRIQNGAEQTQNQNILPNAQWANQFDIWTSPYGFLKGAIANNPTARVQTVEGRRYTVVSFTLQSKYKVNGFINDQNMVEKVETWVDNAVLGDMLVEAIYADYRDFAGLKFPTRITQKQGGFPTLVLTVTDVKSNVPVTIQPTQNAAGGGGGAAPTVTVETEKIVDGVLYLKGGTHHSVAVEFSDHIVVIEAPQNEQRSLAVIAEVKRQIPNKPIRYLVNTHHHFDHSGGLRTYVDEGATIVTHQVNKAFYDRILAAPRTLNPDKLAVSKKRATIETVTNRLVLSDSPVVGDNTRRIELHLVRGNTHNEGMLMAYLPKEKILVEVDVYTPQANQAGPAGPAGGRGQAPGGPPAGPPTGPPAGPPAGQRGQNPPGPPAAGTRGGPPAGGGRGGQAAAAPAAPVNPLTLNLWENVDRLKLGVEGILPLHGPGAVTKADLDRAAGKAAPAGQRGGRGGQ
jgi:glyoxylase-like metal-dependent hydrolase (beta-lactamase superfamily II)